MAAGGTLRMVAMSSEEALEIELRGLRTQVANQAASLAETVTDGFEGFHLGAGDYVVELMAPEGQSTGSGARARQHLRLVPRRRGFSAVVVGTVDSVARTAEIRTLDHVSLLYEARFKRPLDITNDEYSKFMTRLDIVLNLARLRRVLAFAPADLLAKRATSGSSWPIWLAVLLVLALGAYIAGRSLV